MKKKVQYIFKTKRRRN